MKETKIGDIIFVAQTTYYIYGSEEDRKSGHFSVSTSNKKVFEDYKKQVKASLEKKRANE
ncbi:MAG: hypothetical protein WC333_00005 [Dehalococcoidia bacterium]